MDEFEKRQNLASFITTLVDSISRTSPSATIPKDARESFEEAGLKDSVQASGKKWLDMYMHFIDKIDKLGSQYPIEALLGIGDAKSPNP